MTLSRHQLERWDDARLIELGRRVESELDAEAHRYIRTMGELLKARLFGSTAWAINLRKRMTNYVQGGGGRQQGDDASVVTPSRDRPPEPHQWPCGHPHCQPCDDAVKRLLRDVGVLPRKGGTR